MTILPKIASSVAVRLLFNSNHPHSLMFTEFESFPQEDRRDPSLLAKGQLLIPEMETFVFSELKRKRTLLWSGAPRDDQQEEQDAL